MGVLHEYATIMRQFKDLRGISQTSILSASKNLGKVQIFVSLVQYLFAEVCLICIVCRY